MNELNQYSNYSAADIERYHSGKMPAAEMHALEKAALDDMFLADALEGYMHSASAIDDVDLLQKRLAEKLEKGKVVALPLYRKGWLRVAALFVLVASGALLIWQLNKQPVNNLAVTEKAPNEKSLNQLSAPNAPGSVVASDGYFDSAATANEGTAALQENKNKTAPSLSNNAGVKDETAPSGQTLLQPSTANDAANKIAEPEKQNVAGTNDVAANRNQSSANNNQLTNSPSPNANNAFMKARAKNATDDDFAKRSAFATDKNQLAQRNRADTTDRHFKEDNAERASVAANNNDPTRKKNADTTRINVVMQPVDDALNEVVVVGYGAKSKAPKRKEPVAEILEPTEGWSDYNDYIALNLKEPPELKEKAITGEVELSFDINKKGEAINIKVEKGLCPQCDEEAVRLLQEGPKWKTKKKEKKGKVRIRF